MRGKIPSTTASTPKITNSGSGTLRTASTYAVDNVRTSQLRLRRPMPMIVPSTVASTMPATETRKVLRKPWTNASRTGALCESSLPVISNEVGLSRKSKLVGMFCRSAFDA